MRVVIKKKGVRGREWRRAARGGEARLRHESLVLPSPTLPQVTGRLTLIFVTNRHTDVLYPIIYVHIGIYIPQAKIHNKIIMDKLVQADYWKTTEAEHKAALAARRCKYRLANTPYPTPEAEIAATALEPTRTEAGERRIRLRNWEFDCPFGLEAHMRQHGIKDLKDFFENSIDRLDALTGIPGFRYYMYRVSADGNFIRGFIHFNTKKSESTIASVISWLSYSPGRRYLQRYWVCDTSLKPTGSIYMKGTPKY